MRRQILTAKSGISNHAAAGIRDDPCLSKFGTLRECPNVAKTRNGMPDVAWKKYTNFASKNLPPSVLSGTFRYRFFRISLIPILFRYGWRLRGRAGSDAASAGCAALRLARCMPPVMWESAGAASSASIKQARLMESSP